MYISIPINAYLSFLWSRIQILHDSYDVQMLEHNKRFRYLPNNSLTNPIRQLITDQMTKTTDNNIHQPWIFMGWSRSVSQVATSTPSLRTSFKAQKVLVDSPGDVVETSWTMATCSVNVTFFSDKLYILELIESDLLVTMRKVTSLYYDIDLFDEGVYDKYSLSIQNFSLDSFSPNLDVADNAHQLSTTATLEFILPSIEIVYRKIILDPTMRVWTWHNRAPNYNEPDDILEIISLKNTEIL